MQTVSTNFELNISLLTSSIIFLILFQELNSHNKPMMRELIYDLPITPEKRDTIVEYYNCIYLPQLKKASLLIYKQLTSEPAISMCSPVKAEGSLQSSQ